MTSTLTITSCQAANTFEAMAEIGRYLTAKLDAKWDVEFRYVSIDESTEASVKGHYKMATAGEFDISWVCAATYANLMHQADRQVELLAAPLFRDAAYQNRPIYFSYFLVQADSAYKQFADLRGKRFVYNETVSLSGHHTVCAHLQSLGIEQGYFSAAFASGGHVKSIHALANGEADCAAIDSSIWLWYQTEQPDICKQLRLIELLPSYPAPPFIISRNVPHELAQEIRTLLLTLHQEDDGNALLHAGSLARFTMLDDAQYETALHAVRMGATIPLVQIVR